MNFFIRNKDDKTVATISMDETGNHESLLTANLKQKLGGYDELTLEVEAGSSLKNIREENTIVFIDDYEAREYIISELWEEDEENQTIGMIADLSIIELEDEIITEEIAGTVNSVAEAAYSVLADTRWTLGTVDTGIKNTTLTSELMGKTVLEALVEIAEFYECELDYVYSNDGRKITNRTVNIHKQIGRKTGKQFEIEKDITSIKRTTTSDEIKTAIYAVGNEDENGNRITLDGVEWSTVKGNPVNKPTADKILEIKTATAKYGRKMTNGVLRPRVMYKEFSAETKESLIVQAYNELMLHVLPSVNYEANVIDLHALMQDKEGGYTQEEDYTHEKASIGDTVRLIDHYFTTPLAVEIRVIEFDRDLLDESNNRIALGDHIRTISSDVNEVNRRLNELGKEIEREMDRKVSAVKKELGLDDKIKYPKIEEDYTAKPNLLMSPFNPGGKTTGGSLSMPAINVYKMTDDDTGGMRVEFPLENLVPGTYYTFSLQIHEKYKNIFELNKTAISTTINGNTTISGIMENTSYENGLLSSTFLYNEVVATTDSCSIYFSESLFNSDGSFVILKVKLEEGKKVTGFRLNDKDTLKNYNAEVRGPFINVQRDFLCGGNSWLSALNSGYESHVAKKIETLQITRGGSNGIYVKNTKNKWSAFSDEDRAQINFPEPSVKTEGVYTVSFDAMYAKNTVKDSIKDSASISIHIGQSRIQKTLKLYEKRRVNHSFYYTPNEGWLQVQLGGVGELGEYLFDNVMITRGFNLNSVYSKHEQDREDEVFSENLQPVAPLSEEEKLEEWRSDKSVWLGTKVGAYGSRFMFYERELGEIQEYRPGNLYIISFDISRSYHEKMKDEILMQRTLPDTRIHIDIEMNDGTTQRKILMLGVPIGATEYAYAHVFYAPLNSKSASIRLNGGEFYMNEPKEAPWFLAISYGDIQVERGVKRTPYKERIDWEQQVDKKNVVAAINESTEIGQISLDKIDMTGLKIDDSQITSVDGSKVTNLPINYDAAEKYFTEVAEDITNADGMVQVALSASFLTSVDVTAGYQVFIQPYAGALLFVPYRGEQFFTVEADRVGQTPFGYKVVGKQK